MLLDSRKFQKVRTYDHFDMRRTTGINLAKLVINHSINAALGTAELGPAPLDCITADCRSKRTTDALGNRAANLGKALGPGSRVLGKQSRLGCLEARSLLVSDRGGQIRRI
jgi:hypothetical protein